MFKIKFFVYLVSICSLAVGSGSEAHSSDGYDTPPHFTAQKKRLIIDTDAGSDDGVAILNILGAEELFGNVAVELLTAVNGNTHVDNVAVNVLKILKTVDRLDVPVHKGANQSLLWTPATGNYFGEDGFGDFPFEDPPSKDFIKDKHAVNALIEAASLHPGQLSLLCLGPLTNIALAIRLDDDFFRNLKEIFILGGSDNGVGNVKPGVEFNFYVDPEAAMIVFQEAEKKNLIVSLVPWETVSVRSLVDMNWRKDVLGSIKSPQVDLINKAERLTLDRDNWISADTVLSSVVIDDSVVKSAEEYHVDVEVSGRHSRGALFVDYGFSKNETKNARIIKDINVDRYKKMLLQNFNLRSGQTNGGSRR